jgi:hypothetical protein
MLGLEFSKKEWLLFTKSKVNFYGLSKKAFSSLLILLSLHLIGFILTASRYPGSISLYGLYTIVSALTLYIGFYRPFDYGIPLLNIFFWLGGWFKLNVHLILNYQYVEAVGGFSFTANHYNELLKVCIVANLAVFMVWFFSKKLIQTNGTKINFKNTGVGVQGCRSFGLIFILVVIAIAAINLFNIYSGMYQTGIVAKTIFAWPFNAVFGWILSMGLVMVISTLLYLSSWSKKRIIMVIGVAIYEAIFSAGSVLSRGLYIIHLLPVFYTIFINKFRLMLSRYMLLFLTFIAILGFIMSGTFVNTARTFAYNEKFSTSEGRIHALHLSLPEFGQGIASLAKLAVDRWIGIEGVMVAVGYPEKSLSLLGTLMVEKPAIGYITKYQYISNSVYVHMNANKFQFLTLPGPSGMFYLSGSLCIVFVGMALLVLLAIVFERWVWNMTNNPYLCAVVGAWMANGVAQFGVAPRQLLIQLFMHFIGIIVITIFQKWWLSKENNSRA